MSSAISQLLGIQTTAVVMFTEITINCHYNTGHIVEVVFISKVVMIPGWS